jgi:hypothetical protein
LYADPDQFDGVIDAIEQLLQYLTYCEALRSPERARESFGALISIDNFRLRVREKAEKLKIPRAVICGAVIKQMSDGYTLERAGGTTLAILDVVLSMLTKITFASTIQKFGFSFLIMVFHGVKYQNVWVMDSENLKIRV